MRFNSHGKNPMVTKTKLYFIAQVSYSFVPAMLFSANIRKSKAENVQVKSPCLSELKKMCFYNPRNGKKGKQKKITGEKIRRKEVNNN